MATLDSFPLQPQSHQPKVKTTIRVFLEVCKYPGMREFLQREGHVVLSNRDKGLEAAIKKAFPRGFFRKCFKHIERNIEGNREVQREIEMSNALECLNNLDISRLSP